MQFTCSGGSALWKTSASPNPLSLLLSMISRYCTYTYVHGNVPAGTLFIARLGTGATAKCIDPERTKRAQGDNLRGTVRDQRGLPSSVLRRVDSGGGY